MLITNELQSQLFFSFFILLHKKNTIYLDFNIFHYENKYSKEGKGRD